VSCSSDDITPEIQIPEGCDDFFTRSMDFDSDASEHEFTFSSNVPWTISVSETRAGNSWLTVNPARGEAGTHTISVKAEENTTYDDRNAVITLAAGDSIRRVIVNQKQLDAITLTTDRFEVPVEGGEIEVEVKANIDYEVVIPKEFQDWIHKATTANTRGLTSSTQRFTIDKSEEYDKREGKIIVKGKDKEEVITVYQTGGGILTLTQNEYIIPSETQEINIEVSSNFDYSVQLPNVDWIKEDLSSTRGISTHTIRLKIAENETYEDRSAVIRIYDKNSSLSENVLITQSQKNVLLIDKKEYEFDEYGGTFTVNVNSNVYYWYSVFSDYDWILENETASTRSLEKKTYSFTISELKDDDERMGSITFFASNNLGQDVIIKQRRAIFFNSKSFDLPVGTEKVLDLTCITAQEISFSSSDTSVATIDNNGRVKAVGRGTTTITATTTDGKHSCKCDVNVRDITDFVSAMVVGASTWCGNGVIRNGGYLEWAFLNKSSKTVRLKTMEIIDGVSGIKDSQMDIFADAEPNSLKTYKYTVGYYGIHTPVICRFRYEYNGKEYFVDALYN
jgi:hypothetical protein